LTFYLYISPVVI